MKQIKYRQVIIILALTVVLASSCNKTNDTPYGQNLFDIIVPEGWLYQSYTDENVLYYAWSPLRVDDDEAMLQDTINEDLLITREHLPELDLEIFYTYVTSELEHDTSYHAIYATDTVINGESAKKLIHLQTFKLPSQNVPNDSFNLQVKPMKVMFFRDEYGYTIDCGMLPFTYPHYKPIFEEVLSTFQFKN
jgi:hypothetical protein